VSAQGWRSRATAQIICAGVGPLGLVGNLVCDHVGQREGFRAELSAFDARFVALDKDATIALAAVSVLMAIVVSRFSVVVATMMTVFVMISVQMVSFARACFGYRHRRIAAVHGARMVVMPAAPKGHVHHQEDRR
jgi:hypothetical protein